MAFIPPTVRLSVTRCQAITRRTRNIDEGFLTLIFFSCGSCSRSSLTTRWRLRIRSDPRRALRARSDLASSCATSAMRTARREWNLSHSLFTSDECSRSADTCRDGIQASAGRREERAHHECAAVRQQPAASRSVCTFCRPFDGVERTAQKGRCAGLERRLYN